MNLSKKEQKIYFRGRCVVSKRPAQKSLQASIFSGENELEIRRGGNLVPNLRDKKRYVAQIKTLNQA